MKKYLAPLMVFLFSISFYSCGKKGYEKLYTEAAFIADPNESIHWEKNGDEISLRVVGCLYFERDTNKPIQHMQHIVVYVGRYQNEAQLVSFWKQIEIGDRTPVNCTIWEYSDKVVIGLD